MRLHLLMIAAAILLFAALGFLGSMDLEEHHRQAEEYCFNVHAKIWPDFDENYDKYCLNGRLKKSEER